MAGGVHRGHVWQGDVHDMCGMGGMHCRRVCMAGGVHAWQEGVHGRGACMAGETTTEAGSMHPTGMHSSCFCIFCLQF